MEKTLEYYIAHPEEVDPSDADLVAKLLQSADGQPPAAEQSEEERRAAEDAAKAGKTDAGKAEEVKTEVKTEVKPEVKTEPTTAAEEPKGVLTADGKSLIPYSVLAQARAESGQLRVALSEMTTLVSGLQEKVDVLEKGGGKGDEKGATPAEVSAIKEKIDAVREEAPWLAETLELMLSNVEAVIKKQGDRIEELVAQRNTEANDIQADVEKTVTANIDQVPVLAYLRANNPEAWEMARNFDNSLKETAAWTDKPMVDRFKKVAAMVVDALGDDVIPAELRTAQPTAQPKGGKTGLSDAEVKAAAAAKVKTTVGVTTLTDLPGGAAPAQTEEESIEDITVQDLHRKFEKMTPAQQRDYLTRFR